MENQPNYKKCRWSTEYNIDIFKCMNQASKFLNENVSREDVNMCSSCEHFYSEIESDNLPNQDNDTESL
jgi:hypothetical protein